MVKRTDDDGLLNDLILILTAFFEAQKIGITALLCLHLGLCSCRNRCNCCSLRILRLVVIGLGLSNTLVLLERIEADLTVALLTTARDRG